MRKAVVYYKEERAALLAQLDDATFVFCYADEWFVNTSKPAISLTLPKVQQEYRSEHLFPFFYNLLPEGVNKSSICHSLRLDKDDHFGILLATAQHDTIGAIRLKKIK